MFSTVNQNEAMKRLAMKMQLNKGCEAEYKKRHYELWPELETLLKQTGISDYSIFLDHDTNILFGTFKVADTNSLNDLSSQPVMKKWWLYMKDIMASNADHSPVSTALEEVFYLS